MICQLLVSATVVSLLVSSTVLVLVLVHSGLLSVAISSRRGFKNKLFFENEATLSRLPHQRQY